MMNVYGFTCEGKRWWKKSRKKEWTVATKVRICYAGFHFHFEKYNGKQKSAWSRRRVPWETTLAIFPQANICPQVAQLVKNLPANAEDACLNPGSGRSSAEGNGNPPQCSCLENSMDRGAWWAIVYGVANSRTWLSRQARTRQIWKKTKYCIGQNIHSGFSVRLVFLMSSPLLHLRPEALFVPQKMCKTIVLQVCSSNQQYQHYLGTNYY